MLASVASMIDLFNMDNIAMLEEMGYEVHVAANFQFGNAISQERVNQAKNELLLRGIQVFDISIPRRVTDITRIIRSYRKTKALIDENKYSIVHCHTPIGGVIARFAARKARVKYNTKVIYTAHGFHFYKGAPLKNWLLYYPVEVICSLWTDVLITINREDYARAKNRMKAKRIEYVPGVGINAAAYSNAIVDRDKKRHELGVPQDTLFILSVGELIPRKNHETVIRAILKLNSLNLMYFICGRGELNEYLQGLVSNLGLSERVKLLGFRTDITELCKCADLFILPSFQEGLPVALMEAMASGLPCIASNIRGNTELIIEGAGGYLCPPDDVSSFAQSIERLAQDSKTRKKLGEYNKGKIFEFDTSIVNGALLKIYGDISKEQKGIR